MDIIIVRTKEDMRSIMEWAAGFLAKRDELEFRSPFQKGEVQFPFDGCRMEFQCSGDSSVRFKVYPILEALSGDWVQEMRGKDLLLGGFIFNTESQEISDKWFNMRGVFSELSLRYEQDGKLFAGLGLRWLSLMLLAVYYKPELDSRRETSASSAKPRKKAAKSKKNGHIRTLYTRTYTITSDLTESLQKVTRSHSKPDHEFSVRGHFRRCKSGKMAWVRPYTKCKGRKPDVGSTYVAKMEEAERQP